MEEVCGRFENPSAAAFREKEPAQPLYRVSFPHLLLWPEGRQGKALDDRVMVDVFQPWLEPASEADFDALVLQAVSGDWVPFTVAQLRHTDHGDHTHGSRTDVEAEAVAKEQATDYPLQAFAEHLISVLLRKGLIETRELVAAVTKLEQAGNQGHGPRIVARAWCDPEFARLLAADSPAAVAQLGISTSNYNVDVSTHPDQPGDVRTYPHGHTVLKALFNTPRVHNLVGTWGWRGCNNF